MKIEIVPVLEEEKIILSHLIELYEYDFSEFENSDVNSLGLYGYSYLDYYWTEKNRYPYFIKVDGKLSGFVMVCGFCYVSKDKDTLFMSEFFVMKKYRKLGIGKFAAKEVFNMHKGKWELTVHPKNPVAMKFWANVIQECAGDNYKAFENIEGVYDDGLATAYIFEIV
jgi:predicted acetyltransferase